MSGGFDLMDKIHALETDMAVGAEKISSLERQAAQLWEMVEKIQSKLSAINAKIASFGVVNTLILGWIAWRLTRG